MIEQLMAKMTLREKIGQTAMPSPTMLRNEFAQYGGYGEYFQKYPYAGMYIIKSNMVDADGNAFSTPEEAAAVYKKASEMCKIPLLISCDAERGAYYLFDELHIIANNPLLGASQAKELAYKRTYYYARELKRCGVNWPFGPVIDVISNFFTTGGVRCFSDDPDKIISMIPSVIKGYHDAGIACCTKHFPSNASKEYRDSHIANTMNTATLEEWKERCGRTWKAAMDAGADGFMTSHATFPAVEPGRTPNGGYIPSTVSKNVLDLAREYLGYDGVMITDDIGMGSLSSAYDRKDLYVNALNAGNDIVLFCRGDYIDVVEEAVKEGRVSEERINQAVRRVLKLKEKLGLFDGIKQEPPLTEEENRDFERVNYELAQKGMTLITNNTIPFDQKKVKNAAIITISPDARFVTQLEDMVAAFASYDINAKVYDGLNSKEELQEIAENNDIIIYACLLTGGYGNIPWFSTAKDMRTLFNRLSFGADKSVVASFGIPSIYYNYFENVGTYINAYSNDKSTMRAFVDGILGKFEFTGKSPVALKPEFK